MEKSDSRTSSDCPESYHPLLEGLTVEHNKKSRNFRRLQIFFNVIASIYILATLPLLTIKNFWRMPQPHSPANGIISYELHPLLFHEFDERYYGKPEDIDHHWHKLLEPSNIRASKEELQRARADFSDDIVHLSDGGHPAVLATYHELHCLDGLRKNMHKDYYFPNMTEEQEAFNTYHQGHCIESLRRTLMCKADASLYAGYWIAADGSWPSKELRSNSQQVCSNWARIDNWARQRMLPKGKYLVKPGPFDKVD